MGERGIFLLAALLLVSPKTNALDMSANDLHVSGYMDGGRFQLADTTWNGELISRTGVKWGIDKQIDDNWSIQAQLHWYFWRNQATDKTAFFIAGLKFDSDLQGKIVWHDGPQYSKTGVYNFKYNPDSKNLGEYILRCTAYPTIIENAQGQDLFDPAYSKVSGLEYGLDYDNFRTKGIVYFEQFNPPVNDLNLAYFAALGPKKAEVELGIAYQRFLKFGDRNDIRSLEPTKAKYLDNKNLIKRLINVSLRARLDLGAFLTMEQPFVVYTEAALLGLQNDTLFYKNPIQRLPVMLGLSLPTAGILNELALEVEYLKNPLFDRKYPKDTKDGTSFSGLPFIEDYDLPPTHHAEDFRWSLSLQKALGNWIDLKLRCSSDHMRLLGWNGDYVDGEPFVKRSGDWLFLIRLEYHN